MDLVRWSAFSCTITFNSIGNSFFLLLSFISKNISVNGLNVQVGKVHSLAMMFHHPFSQELKAFVVLDELKISKAIRLQELIDHLLMFLISLKKSNLNFVVFLSDKKLFHLQRLIELFDPFSFVASSIASIRSFSSLELSASIDSTLELATTTFSLVCR